MGTIAFSLTAHEAPEVLLGQLRNIRFFNVNALIVLHLSNAFHRLPKSEEWLPRLSAEPGVLLNPHVLNTGWGHIFHAHLSNLKLLRESGETFDYVTLLSSGDLFYRHGLADHLEQFDAAVGRASMTPGWGGGKFGAAVEADPKAVKLRALTPDGHWRHSMHEGISLRRELAWLLIAEVENICPHWTDNPGYPREEIVFSTVLYSKEGLLTTGPVAVHLGDELRPGWMRLVVASAIRLLANKNAGEHATSLLHCWLDANAEKVLSDGVFLLSRVPRDTTHAVRRIITSDQGIDPFKASPRDLVDFELPGRTTGQLPLRGLSPITRAAVISRASEQDLSSALLGKETCIIPACKGTYTSELHGHLTWAFPCENTYQPFIAGAGLISPVEISFMRDQNSVGLIWRRETSPEGRILLCLPLQSVAENVDHLLIGFGAIDNAFPDILPDGAVDWWAEEHIQGCGEGLARKLYVRKAALCLQRSETSVLWLLPWSFDEPQKGRRVLYLAPKAKLGGLIIRYLSCLSLGANS